MKKCLSAPLRSLLLELSGEPHSELRKNIRSICMHAARRQGLVGMRGQILKLGRNALKEGSYSHKKIGESGRGGARRGAGRKGTPISGAAIRKDICLDPSSLEILKRAGGGVASYGLRVCASVFEDTNPCEALPLSTSSRRALIIDQKTIERLSRIGGGNLSLGARRCAYAWKNSLS